MRHTIVVDHQDWMSFMIREAFKQNVVPQHRAAADKAQIHQGAARFDKILQGVDSGMLNLAVSVQSLDVLQYTLSLKHQDSAMAEFVNDYLVYITSEYCTVLDLALGTDGAADPRLQEARVSYAFNSIPTRYRLSSTNPGGVDLVDDANIFATAIAAGATAVVTSDTQLREGINQASVNSIRAVDNNWFFRQVSRKA